MENKTEKIFWFLGPKQYKNSGIGKYSSIYIEKLREYFFIKEFYFVGKPKSIKRLFWQYIYIPIKCIFNQKLIKVFYEELWIPILFFPIKNCIFIVHDIRNFQFTSKKLSLVEKIYFFIVGKSFKKLNSKKVLYVITPSEFTKNELIKIGINKEKIKIICNALEKTSYLIDKKAKEKLFEKYNIPKENINKKLILNVGTEEERKNIITILEVLNDMKDYIFVKIGNPIILENRKKHLDYVNTNGINAVFIENLSIESLEKFYLIADIYLNVSLFEGFGRTLIEAESYDLPILSTNNSGMKEVLKGSPIIIEDGFDKYEIKEKLQKVLYDEKLKKDLIVFGRKNIKRFFVENNVKKWEEILD